MGDDKAATSSSLGARVVADRELLMQSHVEDVEDPLKTGPPPQSGYHAGREAFYAVLQSWASKKFMSGCVILFPIAITFYVTWWFITFFDGFFRPVYRYLGIEVFGVGFVTSIIFIFLVGVFVSSWMGASVLWMGEWFIKRMPLVKHIYSASKQISAAISPDQNTQAFKEVAIISHPRVGEYAIGFITSTLILQKDTVGIKPKGSSMGNLGVGKEVASNPSTVLKQLLPNLGIPFTSSHRVVNAMSLKFLQVPGNGRAYDMKEDISSPVKYTDLLDSKMGRCYFLLLLDNEFECEPLLEPVFLPEQLLDDCKSLQS